MIKIIAEEIVSVTGKKLSEMDDRKIHIKEFEVSLPFIPCVNNFIIFNLEEFKICSIVFEHKKDAVKIYLEYYRKIVK